jgi:hypothetical protein
MAWEHRIGPGTVQNFNAQNTQETVKMDSKRPHSGSLTPLFHPVHGGGVWAQVSAPTPQPGRERSGLNLVWIPTYTLRRRRLILCFNLQ